MALKTDTATCGYYIREFPTGRKVAYLQQNVNYTYSTDFYVIRANWATSVGQALVPGFVVKKVANNHDICPTPYKDKITIWQTFSINGGLFKKKITTTLYGDGSITCKLSTVLF